MITYKEALATFVDAAKPIADIETIPTLYACDRVLARPVVSTIDVPAWDNSQMDGYAVRFADLTALQDGQSISLPISQRIPAGSVGTTLEPGTCARIFTGAPIPEGADTVVPQEDVERQGDVVTFRSPVRAGQWVRRRASDVALGDVVADVGERIKPTQLGLIASVGVGYVEVFKHLRVAVFFSGNELTPPGKPLPPGGIYNSNRYTLRALLHQLDCEVYDLGVVPDTLEATVKAFEKAAQTADLIITSGGMSVGEEDHIKPAIERLGSLDMWKVALKPGKPVALGHVSGVPFIGLPGNPVSSFVTFLMLARPYILRSQGIRDVHAKPMQVRADFAWPKPGKREEFIRVKRNDRGGLDVYPNQNSQVLTSCAWGDGLVDIPVGHTFEPGDTVLYFPFGDLFK